MARSSDGGRTCAWCPNPPQKSGKCRDCNREYMRQYRATARGLDRTRAASRASYRRKQVAEPGHAARHTAAWRARNPEAQKILSRAYVARRRARLLEASCEDFSFEELHRQWDEDGMYGCVYCGGPYEHADHVAPLSMGGAHSIGNLVPACADCNLSKGDADPWSWLRSRMGCPS